MPIAVITNCVPLKGFIAGHYVCLESSNPGHSAPKQNFYLPNSSDYRNEPIVPEKKGKMWL